jgi:membrane-associated phospholipid phosphatase
MRPAEILVAGYNVLLVVVWSPLAAVSATARLMIAAHVAALCLAALVAAASRHGNQVSRLRDLYPVAWLAAFWPELGLHWELAGTGRPDILLLALEQVAFGATHTDQWMRAMHWPWLREAMYAGYVSYYPLLAFTPLIALWKGSAERAREASLRILATYLCCFAIYALFPAMGPRAFLDMMPVAQPGLFESLAHLFHRAGDASGTAFPSSHVAGAVTAAWLSTRFAPRWWAVSALLMAAAVIPATVYTRNHYLVNVLAALVVVAAAQMLLVPALLGQAAMHRTDPATDAVASPAQGLRARKLQPLGASPLPRPDFSPAFRRSPPTA